MARKAKINITAMDTKKALKKKTVIRISVLIGVIVAALIAVLIILNLPKSPFSAATEAIENTLKGKTSLELSDENTGEKYVICTDKKSSGANYYVINTKADGSFDAFGKYDGYYFDYKDGEGTKTKIDVTRSILIDGMLIPLIYDGFDGISIRRILDGNTLLASFVDKDKADECFEAFLKKLNDEEWAKEYLNFELKTKEDDKSTLYYHFTNVNIKKLADELFEIFKPALISDYASGYVSDLISKFDSEEKATFIMQTKDDLFIDGFFSYSHKAFDEEANAGYYKSKSFELAIFYDGDTPNEVLYETDNSSGGYKVDSVNGTSFDAEKAAEILSKCKLKIS